MYCSTSASGVLLSEERSGSGSELLIHRLFGPVMEEEIESTVGLLSLSCDEDDDVQFDSEQLFLPVHTCFPALGVPSTFDNKYKQCL